MFFNRRKIVIADIYNHTFSNFSLSEWSIIKTRSKEADMLLTHVRRGAEQVLAGQGGQGQGDQAGQAGQGGQEQRAGF